MRLFAVFICLMGFSGAAKSDSLEFGMQLGTLIASEQLCELSFDQKAIQKLIEKKVPADDLSFPGNLRNEIVMERDSMKNRKGSEKTAHCTQIRRLAKAYKLLKQ